MPTRRGAEVVVLHADVDAGLEGGVDVVDAVGGEEEDAFVVFEDAEEDGDEFVAFEVVGGALFEEDVGFVEEKDGVPFGGHFENVYWIISVIFLRDAFGANCKLVGEFGMTLSKHVLRPQLNHR